MKTNYINTEITKTLSSTFQQRVKQSPDKIAYNEHVDGEWQSYTWSDVEKHAIMFQYQLVDFSAGDKVAIMVPNGVDWIAFDQAALGLKLTTVPLYCNDNCQNVAYILKDAQVKFLFLDSWEQWDDLQEVLDYDGLERVVIRGEIPSMAFNRKPKINITTLKDIQEEYETSDKDVEFFSTAKEKHLASIVYTSGTTGNPKGVMLTNQNILWNATAALERVEIYPDDHALSFLPLSHMLERTDGYYLQVIAGSVISFARSVVDLPEDLLTQKPTILIAVPRIFERVYNKMQMAIQDKSLAKMLFNKTVSTGWKKYQYSQGQSSWKLSFLLNYILDKIVAKKVRNKLGGNLRFAIVGGAAMNADVAKTFIGLGIPIIQGYGLTETSPVISVNPLEKNVIESVGMPLGGVHVKLGNNNELLVKSPGVMLGYWNNKEATKSIINDGWLHTGDKVEMKDGYIYITGRIKEIIVLSNGEKLPPNDMEQSICLDKRIEQCMIVGEGKPYLSALVVLSDGWNVDELAMLDIIKYNLQNFPGYARVREVHILSNEDMWTVENGCLTPTLKLKRHKIEELYTHEIERLYEGH